MAYTLSYSLAIGDEGLDLRAQLIDTDGNPYGSVINTGFVEIGDGLYLWTYDNFTEGFRGGIFFYDIGDPSTVLISSSINPEETESGGDGKDSFNIQVGHSTNDDIGVNQLGNNEQNISVTTGAEIGSSTRITHIPNKPSKISITTGSSKS